MKRLVRPGLSIVLSALFITQTVFAFSYPLSPEAIREAYFLGKGDSTKLADVFGKYTQTYPAPEKGPYVAAVEFQTPYVVVAEQIAAHPTSYYAPDAEKEFLGKPEICRARVEVSFPYDDVENITVQVFQGGKEIASDSTHSGYYGDDELPWVGIQKDVEYDAAKIDPDKTVTVVVTLENGQTVEADFDLSTIR